MLVIDPEKGMSIDEALLIVLILMFSMKIQKSILYSYFLCRLFQQYIPFHFYPSLSQYNHLVDKKRIYC